MTLRKLNKSILNLVTSGKRHGDSDKILLGLVNGKITLNTCDCTVDEYEEYITKAKNVFKQKIKDNNGEKFYIQSPLGEFYKSNHNAIQKVYNIEHIRFFNTYEEAVVELEKLKEICDINNYERIYMSEIKSIAIQ